MNLTIVKLQHEEMNCGDYVATEESIVLAKDFRDSTEGVKEKACPRKWNMNRQRNGVSKRTEFDSGFLKFTY